MTKKIGRPIKIEAEEKKCTKCGEIKKKEQFSLEPSKENPHRRRNQCRECRNNARKKRNKETGYYKKKYAAMSEEERKEYIAKKSKQNQYRFKTNPEALAKKRAYDKSDKGIYIRYKHDCNRRNRLKRGIKMLLSFEQFQQLINDKCYYCGKINCRGVDRINSEDSYTAENTIPCCKICNQMKNSMTEAEFIGHIKVIINNLKDL